MKISKYFLMAAAAMSLFACSNDDEAGLDKKGENLTMITLSLGKAGTRSLEETAGGKCNVVEKLEFHFYTADGRNLDVAQPAKEEIDKAIASLTSTQTAKIAIEKVPLTARQLVVIANKNDAINVGTLLSAEKSVVSLENMYDNTATPFGQAKSVLTGKAPVPAGSADGEVRVEVAIKPVSSRVEIGKFTAKKTADEVNIKDFDVLGIYMNQFYNKGTIEPKYNNTVEGRTKFAQGSTTTNYTYTNYNGNGWGFMCNDYTGGYGTPATVLSQSETGNGAVWEVIPANSLHWWGYPVLAGDGTPIEGFSNDVAHIVIKLNVSFDKDLTKTESDGTTVTIPAGQKREKYLTVINYYTDANQTQKLEKFVRGDVYKIEDLTFDIKNLTDVPYEGTKSVSATVTVLAWNPVPVTPEIQ